MKTILIILLLISSACLAQPTKITRSQIDESVFRPENGGALTDPWEVNFNVPHKRQTLTVDEDITLGLTGTPEVDSYITIIATGDGTHTLSFPSNWKVIGDVYDPAAVNQVKLYYNGIGIIVDITAQQQVIVDVLETELESAIVTTQVPNQLNLGFNEAVNATTDGWAITTDEATAITIGGISGSGTTNIIFTLSRAVLHSETVTVSYDFDGLSSATTDLAGFELADVTDFPVTVPDPPPPVSQNCDITVCASGCDHTTITAANAAAAPGDIICIGNGTYRETITVTDNDVTFINAVGAAPIISGFEVVGTSGWTVHSGNIYKKTITLPVNGYNTSSTANAYIGNTTILANQILRNGTMMFEAREPDITTVDDLFKWESFKQYSVAQGFQSTQINDATLPGTPPALVGATMVSQGWYVNTAGTISAHDNSGPSGVERIVFPSVSGTTGLEPYKRQAYFIINDLVLLDVEKEWHYESGTLYFWQPGGGTPSGTIEYKARNWGFDVRGRSGVKIIGLTFTGVDPVIGDGSSTNTLVENTDATYMNHHVRHDVVLWSGIYYGMSYNLGSKLLGANSVFKDNVWDISAATMLWMGPNCRVENNWMTNGLYAGNGGGILIPWANDGGQVITRNTLDGTSMDCIFFGAPFNGSHTNMEISYNKMYNFGRMNGDTGATYTAGQTNTTGLNYHHNWVAYAHSRRTIGLPNSFGIYFDQASGPGTIHHNVVWDDPASDAIAIDLYHETINPDRGSGTLLNIYNNTFAGTNLFEGNESSYRTYISNPLDVQRNNIYRRAVNINWQSGNIGNNQNYILSGTNPLFVGSGGEGLDYRIQTGSPAKDAGQVIAGITDGSVGVPDIGAYEFGGEEWVPGYVEPVDDGTVNDDEWSFSLNWEEDNDALVIMNEQDVHTTFTTGSTATFQFTNSKADFYYEGCDNHGIARFEILNNSMVVIATADVDNFAETGSGICDAGTRETHTFTGLAAGTKTARVTFLTADLGQTPPRNCIVFDGGRFYD